jgi:hypothetical protein
MPRVSHQPARFMSSFRLAICGPHNAADSPCALFFIDRIKPRSFNMEMGRPLIM